MLEGWFEVTDAGPSVFGVVWIENYARFVRVSFLVDPSCPVTVLASGDIARTPLPLDDLTRTGIDDRPSIAWLPAAALVGFSDESWKYTYHVSVILTDEHLRSRLGWDVLSQWTSVIDPETGTALFDPRSWDARSPL